MTKKLYFYFLLGATLLLTYFSKEILQTEQLYYNSLAEQLTQEQITDTLNFQKKWSWITYTILPLLLLLKISVIAAVLDVGCFFFGKEIKYKKLFTIVTQAEFVFLGVVIAKIAWFYAFQTNYTLKDLQCFYPLSVINTVNYEHLQTWFVYPLQVVNAFELLYWLVLAYLLGKVLHISTEKGLTIVASSYGVGLLIWVVGIMFLTLNMS